MVPTQAWTNVANTHTSFAPQEPWSITLQQQRAMSAVTNTYSSNDCRSRRSRSRNSKTMEAHTSNTHQQHNANHNQPTIRCSCINKDVGALSAPTSNTNHHHSARSASQ